MPRLYRLPRDPEKSAIVAGLVYGGHQTAGITRTRCGKGFVYFDPGGKRLLDEKALSRIRSLVIPPAWTKVWICPDPSGHLQAVGYDARGRKQYRYHAAYRAVRTKPSSIERPKWLRRFRSRGSALSIIWRCPECRAKRFLQRLFVFWMPPLCGWAMKSRPQKTIRSV